MANGCTDVAEQVAGRSRNRRTVGLYTARGEFQPCDLARGGPRQRMTASERPDDRDLRAAGTVDAISGMAS